MVVGITQSPISSGGNPCCHHPQQPLQEAFTTMEGDPPSKIPLVVRLLENPASPIALPGKIDLYRHDCLHLLLNRGFSLADEAFVIGFTMGNDEYTNWLHLGIFKVCSWLFYPKPYRFKWAHFEQLHLGVFYGRKARLKNLNRFDFRAHNHQTLGELRRFLGISDDCLHTAELPNL